MYGGHTAAAGGVVPYWALESVFLRVVRDTHEVELPVSRRCKGTPSTTDLWVGLQRGAAGRAPGGGRLLQHRR